MSKVSLIQTKPKKTCFYCGHSVVHPDLSCPRIAAAELYEDGGLCRVEFHDWASEPTPPQEEPSQESES